MPGRNPTPTAVRRLQGNPSGRPLPENEPKLKAEAPAPPKWLRRDSASLNIWRQIAPQLERMGVLSKPDQFALAALVMAYRDWLEAQDVVRKRGMFYEKKSDRGGWSLAPHPAVQIRNEAWKRFTSQLSKFGLDPSSRTRVGVLPETTEDEFDEFISGPH